MILMNTDITSAMHDAALTSYPYECCGFLFGNEADSIRVINSILPASNSSKENQRRRFFISPHDYLAAENYADSNNLTLLGIFHSHPDHPPVPSETDREAAQPFFSYVIISVIDGVVKETLSWRLNEESKFEEEEIIINNN